VILHEGKRKLSDKSQQKEVKGWRKDFDTLPREILASESITDIEATSAFTSTPPSTLTRDVPAPLRHRTTG